MCLGIERQKGQGCFPGERGPGTALASNPAACCLLGVSCQVVLFRHLRARTWGSGGFEACLFGVPRIFKLANLISLSLQ